MSSKIDWKQLSHFPNRKWDIFGELILDYGSKVIQWRKIVFLTNGAGQLEVYIYSPQRNFYLHLALYTKIKAKGVINLDVKPKTIELLQENLCDLILGEQFFNMTPKAQSIKIEFYQNEKLQLCKRHFR